MDLHSYFADPDPAVFLNAIRISLNAVCLLKLCKQLSVYCTFAIIDPLQYRKMGYCFQFSLYIYEMIGNSMSKK